MSRTWLSGWNGTTGRGDPLRQPDRQVALLAGRAHAIVQLRSRCLTQRRATEQRAEAQPWGDGHMLEHQLPGHRPSTTGAMVLAALGASGSAVRAGLPRIRSMRAWQPGTISGGA